MNIVQKKNYHVTLPSSFPLSFIVIPTREEGGARGGDLSKVTQFMRSESRTQFPNTESGNLSSPPDFHMILGQRIISLLTMKGFSFSGRFGD